MATTYEDTANNGQNQTYENQNYGEGTGAAVSSGPTGLAAAQSVFTGPTGALRLIELVRPLSFALSCCVFLPQCLYLSISRMCIFEGGPVRVV